jgi:ferredoxin
VVIDSKRDGEYMVAVDIDICVGCGRYVPFCPREALMAWGYLEIDEEKCTGCFGGIYHFEHNAPVPKREIILDHTMTTWTRNCVENCPVGALRVVDDQSVDR